MRKDPLEVNHELFLHPVQFITLLVFFLKVFVTPATMNLGDVGGGVDTMLLAIAISAGVGGFLVVLIIAIILIYLVRRRYKYSRKYYCSKVGESGQRSKLSRAPRQITEIERVCMRSRFQQV